MSTHNPTIPNPTSPVALFGRYRWRTEMDQDARFENECGRSEPLTEEEYATLGPFKHWREDRWCTYEEYRSYYGNPDEHNYIGVILEECCDHCGSWQQVESLWGIDIMNEDQEWRQLEVPHVYRHLDDFPAGYAKEIALELLRNHLPAPRTEPAPRTLPLPEADVSPWAQARGRNGWFLPRLANVDPQPSGPDSPAVRLTLYSRRYSETPPMLLDLPWPQMARLGRLLQVVADERRRQATRTALDTPTPDVPPSPAPAPAVEVLP